MLAEMRITQSSWDVNARLGQFWWLEFLMKRMRYNFYSCLLINPTTLDDRFFYSRQFQNLCRSHTWLLNDYSTLTPSHTLLCIIIHVYSSTAQDRTVGTTQPYMPDGRLIAIISIANLIAKVARSHDRHNNKNNNAQAHNTIAKTSTTATAKPEQSATHCEWVKQIWYSAQHDSSVQKYYA